MTPEITDLFGVPLPTPDYRRRIAKRAQSSVLRRMRAERRASIFWAANLELLFMRGVNIWLTNAKEAPTLAGYSVNVVSSMLEESGLADEISAKFEKSQSISAMAITHRLRHRAYEVSSAHPEIGDLMFNYAADIVGIMVDARGLSESYKEKLMAEIFQRKMPVSS